MRWILIQAVVRKRMEAGKEAKAAYGKRLAEYRHELKERHAAEVAKKKAKKNWEKCGHFFFENFATFCEAWAKEET